MGDWDFYCALCGGPFFVYGMLPEPGQTPPDQTENDENNGDDEEQKDDGDDNKNGDDDDEDSESDSEESNLPEHLDSTIVNHGQLEWLSKLRIIGHNFEATGLNRCYVSGIGTAESYGSASVPNGGHPNFPDVEQDNNELSVGVYEDYGNGGGNPAPLPFHDTCFTLLEEMYRRRRRAPHAKIDLDLLWSALDSQRGESNSALDLDYFEFEEPSREQYWDAKVSFEPWLIDPLRIPALEAYAKNLPCRPDTHATGRDQPTSKHNRRSANKDPFSNVPIEVLQIVLDQVAAKDLGSLIRASRPVYNMCSSNHFWRRRLEFDMPYLFEIHDIHNHMTDVDWHRVYVQMSFQSYPGGWDASRWRQSGKKAKNVKESWQPRLPARENLDLSIFNPKLLAIASRRRVFDCLGQALDLYELRYKQTRVMDGLSEQDIDNIAETVSCLHMPRVAAPPPQDKLPIQTFILSQWSDIFATDKTLTLNYNEDGFLDEIKVQLGDTVYTFGQRTLPGSQAYTITLQKPQWLEGFILSIRDAQPEEKIFKRGIMNTEVLNYSSNTLAHYHNLEGTPLSKRLLIPEPGNTVVGFKGEYGDGRITSFGLLQSSVNLSFPRTPHPDAAVRKMLWKDDIPPAHIKVDPNSALWDSVDYDMSPIQSLYFGTFETDAKNEPWSCDPSKIREISGDAEGQALQLVWQRGKPTSGRDEFTVQLGYEFSKLKRFPIDGAGGERIVGVVCQATESGRLGGYGWVTTKILTNYGRQGVFGFPTPNPRYETMPPIGHHVAGVFASWEERQYRDGPIHRSCKIMGTFTAQDETNKTLARGREYDWNDYKDAHDRPWDPCLPPADWTTEGQVEFGSYIHLINGRVGQMNTFLDLTRPITKIEGIFGSPAWFPIIGLGGMVIHYAHDEVKRDAPECWLGMPTSEPPTKRLEHGPGYHFSHSHSAVTKPLDPDSVPHLTADEDVVLQNQTEGGKWLINDDEDHSMNDNQSDKDNNNNNNNNNNNEDDDRKKRPTEAAGELLSHIIIWSSRYLNGIQFRTTSGNVSRGWGKCGGEITAIFYPPWSTSELVVDNTMAKDLGIGFGPESITKQTLHVTDCVGLKFVLGNHRYEMSTPAVRPVGVQALVMKRDESEV